MTDQERIALEAIEGEVDYGRACDYGNAKVAEMVLEKVKALGYTRQPDIPQDTVEALAKYLYEGRETRIFRTFEELVKAYQGSAETYAETYRDKARKILKLFPEYEPVELEALGDEETKQVWDKAHSNAMMQGLWPANRLANQAISQATIRKNQSKGQLYRVREALNQ